MRPVPYRELTVTSLAEAITRAAGDPVLRQRAAELGEQVRAENGVEVAVQALEGIHDGRG